MPMMNFDTAFAQTDWDTIEPTRHEGTTGHALWRTIEFGGLRVRMVDYSPGYIADHWCSRGHVVLVVSGQITSELENGSASVLNAGDTYTVSNDIDAHRSTTEVGARLFIVD